MCECKNCNCKSLSRALAAEARVAFVREAVPFIEVIANPPTDEINDEIAVLSRLAEGDTIVYSQDGDDAWFSNGDRAWVAGSTIIAIRNKGWLERRISEDDDTDNYRGMAEYDAISEAGRAALAHKGE